MTLYNVSSKRLLPANDLPPVVTASEMKHFDAEAASKYFIPTAVLMERAGLGTYYQLKDRFGIGIQDRLLIVCGKGNNGGDGYVVARYALRDGLSVHILQLGVPADGASDAYRNYQAIRRLLTVYGKKLKISSQKSLRSLARQSWDIVLDAYLGTGFRGTLSIGAKRALRVINGIRALKVAVDIPSGVDATTGAADPDSFQADATFTFGYPKVGLLFGEGREYAGTVVPVDIGLAPWIKSARRVRGRYLARNVVASLLPRRPLRAHKYSVGKVFILAGSKGFTGAPALCAESALKSGAGAVVLGCPETIYSILAKKVTESIVEPLPATKSGAVSLRAWEKIRKRLRWADVVVIGPGLSQDVETQTIIEKIIQEHYGKLLLDADALTQSSFASCRRYRKGKETILTPHYGEYHRLTAKKPLLGSLSTSARNAHTHIILKGAPTITASPDGWRIFNSTGNPGMATVGMGDVLAGCVAGLWAQKMDTLTASAVGVYVHGFAGDIAARAGGERSLVAGDVLRKLPEAFRMLEVAE